MANFLQPSSDLQKEEVLEAVQRYEQDFFPQVDAYLKERSIDPDGLAGYLPGDGDNPFRFGVVNDPLPGHEEYEGMLAMPYLNVERVPVSIRFRCLEDHDCKATHCKRRYRTVHGDRQRIFNLPALMKATDKISICEGEHDALALASVGWDAVALPGADSWQPWYARLFAGFPRIYAWGDPDDAGQKMNEAIRDSLPDARIPNLTLGDVNETLKEGGKEALVEAVETRRRW